MSIASQFRHTLVIRRIQDVTGPGASVDDWGTAKQEDVTFATVRGLIQPRSAREILLSTQAGTEIGDHVGYIMPLAGLTTHDWVELGQVGGVRYDIVTISDAGGQGHHFEMGLRRIS